MLRRIHEPRDSLALLTENIRASPNRLLQESGRRPLDQVCTGLHTSGQENQERDPENGTYSLSVGLGGGTQGWIATIRVEAGCAGRAGGAGKDRARSRRLEFPQQLS